MALSTVRSKHCVGAVERQWRSRLLSQRGIDWHHIIVFICLCTAGGMLLSGTISGMVLEGATKGALLCSAPADFWGQLLQSPACIPQRVVRPNIRNER